MRYYKLLLPALAASTAIIQAEEPPPLQLTYPSSKAALQSEWGVWFEADWLYWKSNETNLGYALNQFSFDRAETMSIGKIANPKFEWSSGLRLALGYNIPYDDWDLKLSWTTYEGKATNSQNSQDEHVPTIYPSFVHPNHFNDEAIFACRSANSKLDLHLNVVDLDFGKQFKAGKAFNLHPHIGLRSAFLDQTYDVNYHKLYSYNAYRNKHKQVLTNYLTHMINNFWGIGIEGGLGAEWVFGKGFSLFGDISTALLYGVFHTTYTESFSAKTAEGVTISDDNHFHAGRVILDGTLAVRWATPLANNRLRLALQGGWEHHMFFSQNQMIRFVDGQSWGNFVQNQGDVYFQGWTARAALFF